MGSTLNGGGIMVWVAIATGPQGGGGWGGGGPPSEAARRRAAAPCCEANGWCSAPGPALAAVGPFERRGGAGPNVVIMSCGHLI